MRNNIRLSRMEWLALVLGIGGMIVPLIPYAVMG